MSHIPVFVSVSHTHRLYFPLSFTHTKNWKQEGRKDHDFVREPLVGANKEGRSEKHKQGKKENIEKRGEKG